MYVIISVLLPVWGKSDKEGKVGGPFLSLASHSVCRRERLSIMEVEKGTHILHLPKSKMDEKSRTKWFTEISVSSLQLKYYQCSQIWPYLQNLHKPISWSIMNIKIHPCRCPQWQYSGEWGMKRLKRWCGAPLVLYANSWSMPIYYALPGWIIPVDHQAGLFLTRSLGALRAPSSSWRPYGSFGTTWIRDALIEQMLTGAKKQNCTNVLRSHRVKNGSALQVAGK